MVVTVVLFFALLAIFFVVLYFLGMLWFSDERNRKLLGLFALGLSMSCWVLFDAIGIIAGEAYFPITYMVRTLAVAVNPYCALVFAREITKSELLYRPAVVRLSIILPVVFCGLILTNPAHSLLFAGYDYPIALFAPTYWIYYVVTISMWVLAFTILLVHFYRTLRNKRLFGLLVVMAALPIIVNILFNIPQVTFPHDFVPFCYFATFAVFALVTNPSASFNVQTKALPSIVESSPDLYFIADPHGVVIDGNVKRHDCFGVLDFVPGETTLDDLIVFSRLYGERSPEVLEGLKDKEKTFKDLDLTFTVPVGDIEDGDDGEMRTYTFAATKKTMIDKQRYKGFIIIMSDVSEYRRMIDEINTQNEDLLNLTKEAEKASETKSTFLANMSHEMRTPLNAIIGLSELELDDDNLEGTARENLEKIYGAGMTLLSTINDILDISKIESGKFELVPVEYDMPSLINDTITLNIMRINEKPIDFRLHISEDLPALLFGDELRVKQIFNNILSNAFKYTREGTVDWTLTHESDGDSVWLIGTVEDSGIGIKKEDIDKLFSDYNQVDTKSNRTIEGTGLGLAITKQMVNMMDGEVRVESEYMKGSKFTVRLRQGYIGEKTIGKNVAESLMKFHYTEKKRDKSSLMLRATIPYARVLVVDDVPTNLDVAKGMMKPYGMTIDCVTSGQAAIDRIRDTSVKYDAIFMDHMMPKMDGVEATRIIRENVGTEYAKNIPIIALTANAVAGTEKMFLANGFQAFLSKPINIMQMDEVINIWVRDKEKEAELNLNGAGESADSGSADGGSGSVGGASEGVGSADSGSGSVGGASDGGGAAGGGSGSVGEGDGAVGGAPQSSGSAGSGSGSVGGASDGVGSAGDAAFEEGAVDGLDFESGLERFGGSEGYLETLRSYAKHTPGLLDELRDVTEDGLPDAAVTVHGVKGSSYGICADDVGRKAEEMEMACKAGDYEFVSANMGAFLAEADAFIERLNSFIGGIDAAADDKPVAAGPDEELLDRLAAACGSYSMDDIDDVMIELDAFRYESGEDLIQWIRERLAEGDFLEVAARLSGDEMDLAV
jgi:signal transduction histidine kinase/CheY-like chemotaxis protein